MMGNITRRVGTGMALALLLIVVSISLVACGGSASPTAPTSSPTKSPAAAATGTVAPTVAAAATSAAPAAATIAPTAATTTAGTLADTGATVYSSQCISCHGDKGQGVTGPALIGADAHFGRFKNGQELFSYVSSNMPMNNPGSLKPDQALQVTAYLLVQNNLVPRDATLTSNTLSTVQFKQ